MRLFWLGVIIDKISETISINACKLIFDLIKDYSMFICLDEGLYVIIVMFDSAYQVF